MRRSRGFLAALLAILALGGCATKTINTEAPIAIGVEPTAVLLMPLDVELSELTAGGVPLPQAAWTAQARDNIRAAVRNQLTPADARLMVSRQAPKTLEPLELQLVKLHGAVGLTILRHRMGPPALRLPTKKDGFDWTLGQDVRLLRQRHGADYALFLYVRDSYSSAGRVAVIAAAALLGVSVQGGTQVGFASLVDLKTGDVVWFNRLTRGEGDLRTPERANESVALLLNDFPGLEER